MAWPSDFNTVQVSGTYVDLDGTPAQGKVTFTATARLRSSASKIVILPGTITATLDAEGRFSLSLPATDDPDIYPVPFSYAVTERFGSYTRSYTMLAPLAGGDIDLTNVEPGVPPDQAPVLTLKTVVGKFPDAEGDIKIATDDLSDVDTSTAVPGEVLEFDGTTWRNVAVPPGEGTLLSANNLSDVAAPASARINLGLKLAATLDVGTAAGTVAAGNDSRITGAAQKAANLSDLASTSIARTNLGLGAAALLGVGTAANTVAAGNDPRITITQDGTIGNTALGSRVSALEISKPHARYYTSYTTTTAAQQIATGGDVALQFPTVDMSDANVVASGTGNQIFTVAPGLWLIEAAVRFQNATTGIQIAILAANTVTNAANNWLSNSGNATSTQFSESTDTVKRFTAAQPIVIAVYVGSTGPLAINSGQATHVSFTRLSA